MSFGRYLAGVALLVVCLGALALGARRLRGWIAPSYEGVVGRVADGVTLLALLTLTLELVGVIGVLELPGVIVGCVVVGGLAWMVGTRCCEPREAARGEAGAGEAGAGEPFTATCPAPDPERPSRADRRLVSAVAIAGVSVVAAAWLGATFFAYRHGMETVDTLWYHLPFAARFVQEHNIRHLQYFDGDAITVFYPANSELLHAFGIVVFGNDVLSPAIDLGWGAFALCCAWAIGRPWGREPHCLLACLPILISPGLVETQPGGALDDIVCIALLLAAVALIVNGRGTDRDTRLLTPSASAMAAIPAGLALGTKYTMIVPAIALGLGCVVLLGRGRRLQHAAIWAGGLILLGGYWYLRDGIAVGNPLPSLSHIGPISLPAPHTDRNYTVWEYLTNGRIWQTIFVPGLRRSLGLAWWAVVVGAFAGGVLAVVSRRGPRLVLVGAVALLSGFAFLVSPQLLGAPGAPFFFSVNVRYGAPALILGLILLPLSRPLRHRRVTLIWVLASALMVLFTALDPGVWRSGFPVQPLSTALHGGSALAGAAVAAVILVAGELWLWRGHHVSVWLRGITAHGSTGGSAGGPTRLSAAAAVPAILVVLAGWVVSDAYAHDRYRDAPPLPVIYAWAQHVHHARIGIVGLTLQYPLTGANSVNHVQYIGVDRPHRGFAPAANCRQWRMAVNRGHYNWVLVSPAGFTSVLQQPALRWTQTSPDAHATLRQFNGKVEIGVLYRITGPLDPVTCPR